MERSQTLLNGIVRIIFISLFSVVTLYLVPGLTNTKWAKLNLISGFPPPLCYSLYENPVNCDKPLLDYEQAIQLAKECETLARTFDPRIVNSEGANVSTHQGMHIYANTNDFNGAYAFSRHSLSCSLVAQDQQGMQRDGSYTIARDATNLESIATVAKHAGERTINQICSATEIRVHAHPEVPPRGPMLPATGIDKVGLRLEVTNLGQRQFEVPSLIVLYHRQISPGCPRKLQPARMAIENLLAK
jgi:hypothetical protein